MSDACPIVFDLDGTLIDSAPDIHAAVNAVLRDHGQPPLSIDRVRSFVGSGVDALWHKIVRFGRIDPAQHRDLVAGFMARYHHATALTRVFPGVEAALGALADAGHPLAICTNKPLGPTQAVLDHFGLTRMFGRIIAGDSLPVRKPDPAPLLAALGDAGPGLFVGDSEIDATCAAAASVPLLLFTRGYRQAPVESLPHSAAFDHFDALPALVAATLPA